MKEEEILKVGDHVVYSQSARNGVYIGVIEKVEELEYNLTRQIVYKIRTKTNRLIGRSRKSVIKIRQD